MLCYNICYYNYVMDCYDYVVLGYVEIRRVIKFNVNVVYMCCYKC